MTLRGVHLAGTDKALATAQGGSKTQAERAAISDRAMIDAAVELILERGTDGEGERRERR